MHRPTLENNSSNVKIIKIEFRHKGDKKSKNNTPVSDVSTIQFPPVSDVSTIQHLICFRSTMILLVALELKNLHCSSTSSQQDENTTY